MPYKVTFYLPESLAKEWQKAKPEKRGKIGTEVRSLMRRQLAQNGQKATAAVVGRDRAVRGSQEA